MLFLHDYNPMKDAKYFQMEDSYCLKNLEIHSAMIPALHRTGTECEAPESHTGYPTETWV